MNDDSTQKVEVAFHGEMMEMLVACAAWRRVSVSDLVRAYVEDWIDIDYPESRGRLTRRGIYRDGPLGLEAQTMQETSRNWREELLGKNS